MTKQDFIFSMIRSGLWGTEMKHFNMSPKQYSEVMVEAEKQCVMGIVTDCMRSNNVGLSKKCVINLMKIQNTLVIENRRLDENVAKLSELFDANDIDYKMMKGQTLATLYPNPSLRIPGDIDFYVPKKDFNRAIEVINEVWGQEISDTDISNELHLAFKYAGSNFEMHQKMLKFPQKTKTLLFDNILEQFPYYDIEVNGRKVKTLDPTLNVFYTFCHFFHHLRIEGVALRQLCDWSLLLHKERDRIDKGKLRSLLKTMNYEKCFAAFGYLAIEKLGLPEEDFPISLQKDSERWAEIILEDIWQYGNWGKYNRNLIKEPGIQRSIQSGKQYLTRYFKYFGLTPKDNLMYLVFKYPKQLFLSILKNVKTIIK